MLPASLWNSIRENFIQLKTTVLKENIRIIYWNENVMLCWPR